MVTEEANEGPGVIVVEVASGSGGDEPAWWAAQVVRMLMRHADRRGLTVGSPSMVGDAHRFSVSGSNPYRALRFEAGIHRAHHVPDSEDRGRIRTSTAVVRLLDSHPRTPELAEGIQPDRVRTYEYPRGLATDHRINLVVRDLPAVLDGDLDKLTAALEDNEDRG